MFITLEDLEPPVLLDITPGDDAVFTPDEEVAFTIRATDNAGVLRVEYSLDGGRWSDAALADEGDGSRWLVDLGAGELDGGEYVMSVRVVDLGDNRAEEDIAFTVETEGGGGESGSGDDGSALPGFEAFLLMSVLAAMTIVLGAGRRRRTG